MKRIPGTLIARAAARNRRWPAFLHHTLVRAARYVDSHRPDDYSRVYERLADYTRLPNDVFCKNLRLIERFADVAGSVVECGVWRGGMIAGIASVLGTERDYYLFDSFEGLPDATEIDGELAQNWRRSNDLDNCRTDESFAYEAMKLARSASFRIVKGWFNDTLPTFRADNRIAVLRLDADWYSSTAECLNYLYAQVVPKGAIILDDYYTWDGCSRALHDFLSANKLRDRVREFDNSVCYLIKSEDCPVRMIPPDGNMVQANS